MHYQFGIQENIKTMLETLKNNSKYQSNETIFVFHKTHNRFCES